MKAEYEERIGARIAALRTARGFTQRQLAHRANVSYSLLTKVESGHKPAAPVFVGAIARALRVDIPRITGQPYDGPRAARVHRNVLHVRRSLLTHDLQLEPETPPRPLADLRSEVARISQLRRQTRFAKLAAELPVLLDELAYLAHTDPQPQIFALLGEAYYAAECLGSGLGHPDVYLLGVERVSWAAQQSPDPLMRGAATWGRAGPLMRDGALNEGLALLEHATTTIPTSTTAGLSVLGSLHLRSALLAARSSRSQHATAHLEEAATIADRVGETNHYELGFGAANVAVTGVTVAIELSDATATIERGESAAEVEVPAERRGHMHIDLARGYVMHGHRTKALRALQEARQAAPEQTRAHPMTRDVTLTIASTGHPSSELTRFAAWLGVG